MKNKAQVNIFFSFVCPMYASYPDIKISFYLGHLLIVIVQRFLLLTPTIINIYTVVPGTTT
jgi:hypothetical protein